MLKTVEALHVRKDYEGALIELQKNEASIPDEIWHFNMGTTFGKLGNWPMARYHFLAAEERGLVSESLSNNRAIAEEKLETQKLERPLDAGDYLVRAGLFAAQGVLTFLGLLLLIAGLLQARRKTLRTFSACLGLAVALLGLNYWIGQWHRAVVVEPQAIFEGPSTIFATRGEVLPGVLVVTRPREDWLEIIYPSRFEGWIRPAGLKELK